MKLSQFERQVLQNQHEILEKLTEDGDEKKHHSHMQRVYNEGFEKNYFKDGAGGNEEILSDEDCKFVSRVINMYDDLYFYWQKSYELQEGVEEYKVRFPGFDLNHSIECKMYSYADHLINDLGYFHDTRKLIKSGMSLNSHGMGPGINGYREMLEIFNRVNKERSNRGSESSFTIDEIKEVVYYNE